jgi:hypothetical protein
MLIVDCICIPAVRLTKTAADGYRAAIEIACDSSLLDFKGAE